MSDPTSFNKDEICFMLCCAKYICQGCSYKEVLTDINNGLSEHALLNERKCALCRQVMIGKNIMKQRKKLIKKNNANAYIQMACLYRDGEEGLIQSYTRSLEMSIKAAELDHVEDMNTMFIRKLTVLEAHRLDGGVVLNSIHQLIHVLVHV